MPVFAIANSKGGSGKSTIALNTALGLAELTSVTLIDADPNHPITTWGEGGACPDNLNLVKSASEKDILGSIDRASDRSQIVIVDLEGVGSRRVSYALSRADLVLIPMQEQRTDIDQAASVIEEIELEQQRDGRMIPRVGVFTRTRVVAKSKTARLMADQVRDSGELPLLTTELNERDAFSAMWAYSLPLRRLDPGRVNNIPAAIVNATCLCEEIIEHYASLQAQDLRKIA